MQASPHGAGKRARIVGHSGPAFSLVATHGTGVSYTRIGDETNQKGQLEPIQEVARADNAIAFTDVEGVHSSSSRGRSNGGPRANLMASETSDSTISNSRGNFNHGNRAEVAMEMRTSPPSKRTKMAESLDSERMTKHANIGKLEMLASAALSKSPGGADERLTDPRYSSDNSELETLRSKILSALHEQSTRAMAGSKRKFDDVGVGRSQLLQESMRAYPLMPDRRIAAAANMSQFPGATNHVRARVQAPFNVHQSPSQIHDPRLSGFAYNIMVSNQIKALQRRMVEMESNFMKESRQMDSVKKLAASVQYSVFEMAKHWPELIDHMQKVLQKQDQRIREQDAKIQELLVVIANVNNTGSGSTRTNEALNASQARTNEALNASQDADDASKLESIKTIKNEIERMAECITRLESRIQISEMRQRLLEPGFGVGSAPNEAVYPSKLHQGELYSLVDGIQRNKGMKE